MCGVIQGSNFILLHMDIQFSHHHLLVLKRLSFPIVFSWYLCWKFTNLVYLDLFLGSLLCLIALCVCFYTSTILVWLLLLCNTIWNQEEKCLDFRCYRLTLYCFYSTPVVIHLSQQHSPPPDYKILYGIYYLFYVSTL